MKGGDDSATRHTSDARSGTSLLPQPKDNTEPHNFSGYTGALFTVALSAYTVLWNDLVPYTVLSTIE